MDDQDKKPIDAENLSDEELDEVAGGMLTPAERNLLYHRMSELKLGRMSGGRRVALLRITQEIIRDRDN